MPDEDRTKEEISASDVGSVESVLGEPETTVAENAETREERVTGKPPVEETLDKNSREYHALHGWPDPEGD